MKYALIRNDEKTAIAVGYLNPNPIQVGSRVWVGSLSSREGWTTTEVTEIYEDGMSFKTLNNQYRVIPLDDYYNNDKHGW